MKAIVLGAGKGTRLQSEQFQMPKVLRQANGRALISYVLEHINFIPQEDTVVVVGYKKEAVREALKDGKYLFSDQDQQLGTGHAVNCARDHFEGYDGNVLVLYGDMPLLSKATYEKIIKEHEEKNADCTIMTAVVDESLPYGRIIKDENGNLVDIVETKDCTPEQLAVKELNIGVYVFRSQLLFDNLKELKNNNAQGEYYLTDIPKILLTKGAKIATCTVCDNNEIFGVNTVEDLEFCEKYLAKTKA